MGPSVAYKTADENCGRGQCRQGNIVEPKRRVGMANAQQYNRLMITLTPPPQGPKTHINAFGASLSGTLHLTCVYLCTGKRPFWGGRGPSPFRNIGTSGGQHPDSVYN